MAYTYAFLATFRLALAKFLIKHAGNVGFGPEVYKTKAKDDVDSFQNFESIASPMITDIQNTELKGNGPTITLLITDAAVLDVDYENQLNQGGFVSGRISYRIRRFLV